MLFSNASIKKNINNVWVKETTTQRRRKCQSVWLYLTNIRNTISVPRKENKTKQKILCLENSVVCTKFISNEDNFNLSTNILILQ